MVLVIPVQPLVFVLNILCSLLPCRNPYQLPEIVYDHSNDLISAKYLNNSGSDYFDVSAALEKNVVQTNLGVIEGYYQTTTGGRKIGAFEGIRYAKAERWEVIRESFKKIIFLCVLTGITYKIHNTDNINGANASRNFLKGYGHSLCYSG